MKRELVLLVFLMAGGFFQSVGGGQLINVDFQPGGLGGESASNYFGQGVIADLGNDVWNVIAPDTSGSFNGEFGSGGPFTFGGSTFDSGLLLDSEGALTPVTVSVDLGDPEAAFAVSFTNASIVDVATNAVALMSDYLIAQDDATSFVINNLTNGGIYNLVLYGAGDLEFRNTTFIVGDEAKTTTGIPLGGHGLTEGQDYVVFNGVVAHGGTILVRYLNGGESSDGNVNGFQLEAADPVVFNTVQVINVAGLSFSSVQDAVYRLQYTEDLLSTNWLTAPVILQGTGGPMTVFDPAGLSTQKAYRIFQE